ncbi:MAG: GNAT family N-acetyltransferase [Oscillospiraceae bacterium]|nr:MAG: GNAT family N-acetyltransferase [Oscillospiraceae bacterium]
MQQLMMLRPAAPVTPRPLPAGYAFVPFGGTQAEISDWLTVCAAGLLPNTDAHWFEDSIRNYPDLDPARDLFFVTDAGGARIATSAAVRHADGTGYIHMVGALPACRGKGIGHAMLAHALEELQVRACPVVTLTTDDHRLAAIKTYLDAGFRPVLRYDPDSDMRARWDAVIAALGYEPVAYLQET